MQIAVIREEETREVGSHSRSSIHPLSLLKNPPLIQFLISSSLWPQGWERHNLICMKKKSISSFKETLRSLCKEHSHSTRYILKPQYVEMFKCKRLKSRIIIIIIESLNLFYEMSENVMKMSQTLKWHLQEPQTQTYSYTDDDDDCTSAQVEGGQSYTNLMSPDFMY